MAYPLPITRRRRRRRLTIVAVALLAVAIVVALAVRVIAERNRVAEYLDMTREVAATFNDLGVRADTVLAGLESADRASVLSLLSETSAEAGVALEIVAEADPPGEAAIAAGFFEVATTSWRNGLGQMEAAFQSALNDPADVVAAATLREAFLNMRVGDRAYAQFLEVAVELDESGRSFPNVVYIPAELGPRFTAATVMERIAALERLAPSFDIAVSDVRFEPAPSGERDGQIVIPFSATLTVEATVTNRGTEPVSNIVVGFRLLGFETGDLLLEDARSIELLEPAQAVNVTFADLSLEPGNFYEVVISAPLDEDEDPDTNTFRRVFYRNDST